jgi:hypothetical protein
LIGKEMSFVCDPLWAVCNKPPEDQLLADFLIPEEHASSVYFPCPDAPIAPSISFPHFMRQMILFPDREGFRLRHESHAFDRFEVRKGHKRLLFSCANTVTWVSVKIEQARGGVMFEHSRVYTHAQVVEKVGDRVRFFVVTAFPEPAQYRCTLYLNGAAAARWHPYATAGTSELPYLPSLSALLGGTINAPSAAMTILQDGVASIDITLKSEFADFRAEYSAVRRPNFNQIGAAANADRIMKWNKEKADGDRVRLHITLSFPRAGTYVVFLSFHNASTEYEGPTFYFDARNGTIDSIQNPV